MSEMDWQQKAAALDALAEIQICIRKPGDWYVHQDSSIGDGSGISRSCYGNGETPQEAIEAHWRNLTELDAENYVIVSSGQQERRRFRWNGFMWRDVTEITVAALTKATVRT